MSNVTGIVKVTLNGTTQRSEIGAELDFGGYENTAAVGHKLYGFSQKYVPAHLKCTIFHMSDTDLLALNQFAGGTAAFICDTGPVFQLTNVTKTKCIKLKGGDGKVDFEADADAVDTQS
jgi:hypothetical protein